MNELHAPTSPKILSVYSLAQSEANKKLVVDLDGSNVNGKLRESADPKEKEDILKEEDAVAIASCLDPNLECDEAVDTENNMSGDEVRRAASLQDLESHANNFPTLVAKAKGKKNASGLCSHEDTRQKEKRGRKSLSEDDRDPTYVMEDSFQSSDDEVEPIKRRLRRAPKKRKLGLETFTQHLEAKRPVRGKRSQGQQQTAKESKVASPQTGHGEKLKVVMYDIGDGHLSHDERMRTKEKNIEHLKYLIRQQEEAIEKIRQEKNAENVQRVEAASSLKSPAGTVQGKPIVADLRRTPLLLPKVVTVVSNGVHVPIPGSSLTSAIQSLKVSPGTKIVQIIPNSVTSSTGVTAVPGSSSALSKPLVIKQFVPGTSEARTKVFSSAQSDSSSATVNSMVSFSNGQWIKHPTPTAVTRPSLHLQAPNQAVLRPEIQLRRTLATSRTPSTPVQPVISTATPRTAPNDSGGVNIVRLQGGLSGTTNVSGVFVSMPVPNSTGQQLVFVPNHITPNIVSPGTTSQLSPGTGHVRPSVSPQVPSGSQVVMLPLQQTPNGVMLPRPVLVQPSTVTSSNAAPPGERIVPGLVPSLAPAPAKRLIQPLPKRGSTTFSTTTSFVVQNDRCSSSAVSSGQGDSTNVTVAPTNTTVSRNPSDVITVCLTRSTTTERVVVTFPKITEKQNGSDQSSLANTTIGITTCIVNGAQEHQQATEKPSSSNSASMNNSAVHVSSADSPSKCLQPTSFMHAKNVLKNALSSKMGTAKDDRSSNQSSDALSVLKTALKTHFTPDALKSGSVTVKKEFADTENPINIGTMEAIPDPTKSTSDSDSSLQSLHTEAVPRSIQDSGVMYSKFPIKRSPTPTDEMPALPCVKPSVSLERNVRAKVLSPNGQYVTTPLPGGLANTVSMANKTPGSLTMGKKNQQQLSGILVKLKDGGVRFVKLADDGKVDKLELLKASTGVPEGASSTMIKKESEEMTTPQTSSCGMFAVTSGASYSTLPMNLTPFSCSTSAPLQNVAGRALLDMSGVLPTMISQTGTMIPSSTSSAGSTLLVPSSCAIGDSLVMVGTDSKSNSEQQGAAQISVSADLGKNPTLILRTCTTEDHKKVGIPLGKQERLIQLENRTQRLHSFVPRADDTRFTCLTGLETVVKSLSEWEPPIHPS